MYKKRLVKYAKPDASGRRVLDIDLPALREITGGLSRHTVRRLFGSYVVNVLKDPQLAMLMLQDTDLALTTSRHSEQDTTMRVADARAMIAARDRAQEAVATVEVLEKRLVEEREAHARAQQQLLNQISALIAQVQELLRRDLSTPVTAVGPVASPTDLPTALQGFDTAAVANAAKLPQSFGLVTVA